jgi:hypothetical protein
MGVVTSIIAGTAAVAGTAKSIIDAKKAKKAGKAANAAQVKANRLKNAQAKRAFLRSFQQAQAAALVSAISSGVGIESSVSQAGLSSLASQKATQIAEFKEFDKLGVAVASNRQAAAGFQASSATFGQVASFASKFVSFGGGGPKPTPDPKAGLVGTGSKS